MKIEMPSTWQFKTEIEIRVTDLNYGNHLANQQFLAFAQEARMKFFNQFSFTELDFGGTSLIQADAAITYKGEGHLADIVEISVSAIKTGNSSFNVFYSFWNKTKNAPMADLRTALVCFDYSTGKPVGISEKAIGSGIFLS
ncbi:MAG: thioesterase family protein [Bacteroidia bacterium]|nr:thioesterase family protein [Bacteroidia bacterium]NNJ56570.1 esterase [Bacteroidia bacterium]